MGLETEDVKILELVGPSPREVVDQSTCSSSSSSDSLTPACSTSSTYATVFLAQQVSELAESGVEAKKILSAEDKERLLCIICMDEYKTAVLVHEQTGHIVCCIQCARILLARGDKCPVCREKFTSVVQYFS